MRVLIVEDDPELSRILRDGLGEHHIDAVIVHTFADGSHAAFSHAYDVIILDIMLPGGSGLDLCAQLRSGDIATPILMLTARSAVDDRVRGLEAGADDYLVKPFAFRELLARIHALARRQPRLEPSRRRIENLEVDLRAHRVRRAGTEIVLTGKEYTLLEFFLQHEGEVVDRAAITAYVWDDNHDPFTNVLEVLVRRLRRKIDEGFTPRLIHTVRGAGYRFGQP
ncbi:MAG TPA: response regulator transcription factor [Gemmatimonadaceae bacterium]|jgi:two-component system copper resistance phosphate regulon response regulator CusR|nr:response regulator transcription factor [Gemmatimonadaceae bacterium]